MYPGMCSHGEAFTGWCLGVGGVGGGTWWSCGSCAHSACFARSIARPRRASSTSMAHRRPRFPPGSFAARWVRWGRFDMVMGLGAYVAQGLLDPIPQKHHTSTTAGQASYLG